MRYYETERCLFDDENDPDEIYDSVIRDIEENFTEKINWRKAKPVMDYIKEAIDNEVNPNEIFESACHQLEELGY